jgi:hypothetical protein
MAMTATLQDRRTPEDSTTPVAQQADLLARLKSVLDNHPAGAAFHLLYAAASVPVASDEVLVQRLDAERGVLEVRPCKLTDLRADDVLQATQVIDPADAAVVLDAAQATAGCHSITSEGRTSHNYWM